MKTRQKFLGLLGLSMGLGSLLSLTPIDLVHAGSFNRDITHDGQKMGHVEFTWDDDKITGDSITDFRLLDDFSFVDHGGTKYDLDFVTDEAFIRRFDFNLITEKLTAEAYKFSSEVPTNQIGFKLKSMRDAPLALATNQVNTYNTTPPNYHTFVPILSQSDVPVENVLLEEAEEIPQNNIPSVPENSLTTALLVIAGVVLIGSKKAF